MNYILIIYDTIILVGIMRCKLNWGLIIVLLLCLFLQISNTSADSGFDIDYDSSSGSSGSSSGWADSSSSSSGSSSGSNFILPYTDFTSDHPILSTVLCIFCSIFIIIIIFIFIKSILKKTKYFSKDNLLQHKLNRQLENKIILIFKNVQKAWMNLDLIKVRDYLTDELYNMYDMQLQILKQNKQKNIIKNIFISNIEITSIEEQNNLIIIKCKLFTQFRDYIINDRKQVIKGSKFDVHSSIYSLEFIFSNDNIYICQNCGAKVNSNVCDYCHSSIPDNYTQLVLAKKEIIAQRTRNIKTTLIALIVLLILAIISIIRIIIMSY